jgi:hypothetical protein
MNADNVDDLRRAVSAIIGVDRRPGMSCSLIAPTILEESNGS